jgi:RHS repeat-associated protein
MCWSAGGPPAGFALQTYGYDLAGDMTSATNGEGVTLNYSYNAAPRLTGATSSWSDTNHPAVLFSGAHFNAAGSLLSATMDNGLINETRCYDGRSRLANIVDTALNTTLYSLTVPSSPFCGQSGIWGYAPDNTIVAAWDSVNGNWSYAYDPFNRLGSASTNGQSYTYAYDRFGNRWQQNGPHTMMLTFASDTNRMDGYSYDAAGNLLNDGRTTYTYDAENRIISSSNQQTGVSSTYVYNADGRRVRKTVAGVVTDFLYDLGGSQVAAVSGSGTLVRGEVYASRRHLATYSNGTTYFNFADHLGTERARASVAGMVYETCTSLPFGDSLTCSNVDSSPLHFTGKERDVESGLDNFGARYFGSSMGRLLSPDDPFADQDTNDPQSWNLYSYVRNNPLSNVDPDGHDCVYFNDNDQDVYLGRGNCQDNSFDHSVYFNQTIDENSFVYDPSNQSLSFGYSDVLGGATLSGVNLSTGDSLAAFANYFNRDNPQGFISGSALMMAENGIASAIGKLAGLGVEAYLSARAARAAAATVDFENVSTKIEGQMLSRGWTRQSIVDTVQQAKESSDIHAAINKATGGPATEYIGSTGRFVVIDNTTKQVIQVSDWGHDPNYLVQ